MSGIEVASFLKRTYPTQVSVFIIFILVYGALSITTPFNILIYKNAFGEFLYAASFVCFVGIVIEGFVIRELSIKPLWMKYYLAFLVVMIITAFVNYEYDLIGNLKAALSQFTMFTTCSLAVPLLGKRETLTKCVHTAYCIILVLWTVACVVSIAEFFIQYADLVTFSIEDIRRQGFLGGRLFGVFQDPNFAAIVIVLLFILAFYYYVSGTIKYGKATSAMLFVCLLYFTFSGSRTADICFVICVIIAICALRYGIKHSADKAQRTGIFKDSIQLTVSALVVVIVLGLAMPVYATFARQTYDFPWMANDLAYRTDLGLSNISNNRFDIWKSYIECSDAKSAAIGRGYRTYQQQVIEQHPDSYIAKTKYEAHNGFILLYESTGLVGVVLWGAFAIALARMGIRKIRREKSVSYRTICALSLFTAVVVTACFFTTLWFISGLFVHVFAMTLGYFCWVLEPDSLNTVFGGPMKKAPSSEGLSNEVVEPEVLAGKS